MARHRKLTQKFAGFPMFKLATGGDTYPLTSPFTTDFAGLDKLALDLQFALDKTLTARKGPTPVFTRGSGATFVDSDKLIKYGAENLSLYSGQLVIGTGWGAGATPSVTSIVSGLGPDGNNAYQVTEATPIQTHALFNTGGSGSLGATSVASGTIYNGSIFIKKIAGSVDWIQLTFGSVGFGTFNYANFNISNGTIGNSDVVNPEITDAGNGWYRCSISAFASATVTNTANLSLAFTNNTDTITRLPSYAGNTANKVLVAMCQFERSSIARTYIPTTTAALYGPRFDHDPVTGVCKGLLIEEQRTNAAWYSGAIVQNIGWTGSATSSVSGTGPDGSPSYQISEVVSNNIQSIANTGGASSSQTTSVVNGTIYTGSIFVKKVAGSVDWMQLTFGGIGFGSTQYANFNIGSGTVGNFIGLASGTAPRIENYGNGWYRLSISVAATATIATNNAIVGFIQNTNGTARIPVYAGNTSNSFLATMCQFETGTFPTSYIPTVGASAIRSADTCSISGSAFNGFYNQTDSTIVINALALGFASSNNIFYGIESGTTGVMRVFNRVSSANRLSTSVSGVVLTPDVNYNTSNVAYKSAVAANANGADFVIDGTQIPDVFTGSSLTADNLKFSGIAAATSNNIISSFKYYKKRLPVSKLQTLTV